MSNDEDDDRSLKVCNRGSRPLLYATWFQRTSDDGAMLECPLRRTRCVIEGKGWQELGPGSCRLVEYGDRHQAFLSVWRKNGADWVLGSYSAKPEWARGIEPGASGIEHGVIQLCGRKDAPFESLVPGRTAKAGDIACRPGEIKIPANLMLRTEPDMHYTVDLN